MSKPIRRYVVGVDLTQERYDEILGALTEWFKEYRPKTDPAETAKYTLDCCLAGVKLADGQTPWTILGQSSLASRIKSAARYDIEEMQPLAAKPRLQRKKDGSGPSAVQGLNVDKTYATKTRKRPEEVVYGDNPSSLYTTQELKRRAMLKEAYIEEFPQLDNVASMAKLEMMLDLILLMDRLRIRVGKDVNPEDIEEQLTKLTKQLVELEKALNIHADQLAKQQREKEGGTIGEAVRRFEEEIPLELRERWFAEELILIWQMFHQPSPRENMGGHQLDEVGLFGMTRCRTCSCSKCGERNFAGLSINEIEEYLIENGHISPVTVYKEATKSKGNNADSTEVESASEGDSSDASAS